jgi:hypothetical protein
VAEDPDPDPRALLAAAQDPARYTGFLDDDPAPDARPAGSVPAPDLDRPRDLAHVAARLAAALTGDGEGGGEEDRGGDDGRSPELENPIGDPNPDSAEDQNTDSAEDQNPDSAGPVAAAPGVPHHRLRHPVLRPPLTAMRTAPGAPEPDRAAHYRSHSADLTVSGGLQTALACGAAACALAEQYALRRVGGSSAGAVTAAAAAAAELGRTLPHAGGEPAAGAVRPGFAGLAGMLAWLAGLDPGRRDGEGSPPGWRLARMLRPDAATRSLHRLATAAFGPGTTGAPRRGARLVAAALGELDRAARIVIGLLWLGVTAGCTGVVVAIARSPYVADVVVAVAAVPIAVTGALAATAGTLLLVAHAVIRAVRDGLGTDGFGLVPGVEGAAPDPSPQPRLDRFAGLLPPAGTPALVDWISDRLDDLAGIPAPGGSSVRYALTFGELWLGRMGGRAENDLRLLRRATKDPRRRVVDLVLVAADLSAGRPRLLPFGAAERPEQVVDRPFLFCRACLVEVLPARVVDQMVLMAPDGGPAGTPMTGTCPRHEGEPLSPLPEPWDLPVAFAVRLAAAIPGVLRPVPLYAVAPDGSPRTHWFGDGAVTGGLPARTFDAPLPWWPTFTLGVTGDPDADDVSAPALDAAPSLGRWRPVAGSAGYAAAVLAAASTWRDAVRAVAPGRRAGLGCVSGVAGRGLFLTDDEIGRLAARGYRAGGRLRERFTAADGAGEFTGTDRFRWIRLRQALTEYRQLSLSIGTSIPLYTDFALAYRVPDGLGTWFSPPLAAGQADPAWGDAVAAVTHLRSLAEGGVLDWDTDWGAPPTDPHERLG